MPTIQPAEMAESGRYDDYGAEMLRITDRHERDMLFGPTNEEQVTDIFRSHVRSYKSMPLTFIIFNGSSAMKCGRVLVLCVAENF